MNLKAGIKQFSTDTTASVAIITAFALVAMIMVAGMAVDYVSLSRIRTELQSAADSAVVAGAREIPLASSSTAQIEAVAENFARTNLGLGVNQSGSKSSGGSEGYAPDSDASSLMAGTSSGTGDGSSGGSSGGGGNGSVTVTTVVNQSDSSITVEIERAWEPFFAGFFPNSPSAVKVSARAQVIGTDKICVLALDETVRGAVALSMDAKLIANGCGVYSNSTDTEGLASYKNSLIEASLICSAGGVGGGALNFSPAATTDCPAVPDPLSDREPPTVGLCDFTDMEVTTDTVTLYSGTYCGGLLVTGDSVVTFAPGVYVIKDGPLSIGKNASVTGEYVGFYLTGTDATFLFTDKTSAEFSAPKDGPLAGLLFFEDRNAPLGRTHTIVSDNTRKLVGTIYLPRGIFNVSSKQPVADQSAYTAIVAQEIRLNRYPQLVLNTDYNLTDVPVPSGLSGIGGRIVLTE